MPPFIALVLWFMLLVGLILFDPAKEPGTSLALWVPLTWMFIIGSRLPSQWLGAGYGSVNAQALEEGNPLDRAVFTILIVLAVTVLISRSFKIGEFISRNFALIMLLTFALISIMWSDFPFVAFKRWFRDLGNYFVILVVLSDPRPLQAVRTLLRRLWYLLVPLSILLNKYFPALSRQYDQWTGSGFFVGAATSKNMLGNLCLLSAIFFFWDTAARWHDRKERRTKRILLLNVVFFAMTLWLLNVASSATSSVCLAIACVVIVFAHLGWTKRHPGFLKVMIPAAFCLYLILAFGFNLNGEMASEVGRNPTLSDRTLIWQTVLSMHTNPLVGTGYESFWLGPQLLEFYRRSGLYGLNEAHNGFIEVYLNLGLVGDFLLGIFLIASYWTLWKRFRLSPELVSLGLAMWVVTLFYNMTEAAVLKGNLAWLTFLITVMLAPKLAEAQIRDVPDFENQGIRARVLAPQLETVSQRR